MRLCHSFTSPTPPRPCTPSSKKRKRARERERTHHVLLTFFFLCLTPLLPIHPPLLLFLVAVGSCLCNWSIPPDFPDLLIASPSFVFPHSHQKRCSLPFVLPFPFVVYFVFSWLFLELVLMSPCEKACLSGAGNARTPATRLFRRHVNSLGP